MRYRVIFSLTILMGSIIAGIWLDSGQGSAGTTEFTNNRGIASPPPLPPLTATLTPTVTAPPPDRVTFIQATEPIATIPQPATSPPGVIYFVSSNEADGDGAGQTGFYKIDPDGTNLSLLRPSDYSEEQLAASPDGQKIAYYVPDGHDIYVMNADGSQPANLTRTPDQQEWFPAWSPDGQRLSYQQNYDNFKRRANPNLKDEIADLYLMNPDGTNSLNLTHNPPGNYSSRAIWSPDGQHLAFLSFDSSHGLEAYLINADGSGLTHLTAGVAADIYNLKWSADGQQLVFSAGFEYDTYKVNVDGSGLTYWTLPKLAGYDHFGDLQWSPDGQHLSLCGYVEKKHEPSGGISYFCNLFTMKPDGANLTRLSDPTLAVTPSTITWSPDGRQLAFAARAIAVGPQLGHDALYRVKIDTLDGQQTRLTEANFESIEGLQWCSSQSLSATIQISSRRLIDDQAERMYASGTVAGIEKTLVLAYADERLLATYDLVGELALDNTHHRLYIDQGQAGLAVINTQTEGLDNLILLPAGDSSAPPQADPASGSVLAFRDNMVYILDPETGTITDTFTSEFTQYIDCASGPVLTAPSIFGTRYDPAGRILYTASVTSICNSSASGGSGYGVEAYRLDSGTRLAQGDPGWSWFLAQGWTEETGPIEFDPQRRRFYQVTGGSLRVFDAETMALSLILPQPVEGNFEHFNPTTDQLQFRLNGQLVSWPASAIQPPAPELPIPQSLPPTPVTFLTVSPNWVEDQTLFGFWIDPAQKDDCKIGYLNWGEGLLFLSPDGGQSWGRTQGGLTDSCELMTSLGVSPDYARDQTLFAGVWGLGIFKSTDGGQLWLPASVGLTDMGISEILLSPGFGQDQTAFARAGYQGYYHSKDGGRTWQKRAIIPDQSYPLLVLALSPEFVTDKTLASLVHNDNSGRAELYLSRDGGEQWELKGGMPEGVYPQALNLAPLFVQRQTLFVYGTNNEDSTRNALYRSTDGGGRWEIMFSPEPSPGPYSMARPNTSLLYAPGLPENRLIFLLASEALYWSKDEGQTWRRFELAENIKPTALAISPDFAQDRTLFVGTAGGQVLTLPVME